MNDFLNEYKSKLVSADEAVRCVESGNWVDYTMAHGIPVSLDRALANRKDELKNVKVRGGITLRPLDIIEKDPNQEAFSYSSWHFTKYDRDMAKLNRCHFIPLIYREQPQHYRNLLDVDVAMVATSPMDKHGYFSLSLMNSGSKAVLDKAKTVIVEVNSNLPSVYGLGEDTIHISEVDMIVEGENPIPVSLPPGEADDTDVAIAEHILPHIVDGALLQLGIGTLPNTIGNLLAQSDLRDLGMHTEMAADAYLTLYKAGKLTNKRKNTDNGIGVWSFALGSSELYEWLNNNPGVRSAPISYTNSPEVMSRNENLICINGCVEVDIYGQVSAESSGINQISGTGGQLDFVTGASISKGGKSFLCMPSTFKNKDGKLASRITTALKESTIVSVPRSQSTYIVTEYGAVNLAGSTTWERAEKLISIAHPDFREALSEEARKMRIWR